MPTATETERPEVTLYWVTGCSSCLKAKEFIAGLGRPFESFNIADHPAALAEVEAAGIRGVPAVRRGTRFAYAQSIDDLAAFLGVARGEERLPRQALIDRWATIQDEARAVIAGFPEDQLFVAQVAGVHPTLKELGEHAFRIVESFLSLIADDSVDARGIYLDVDESIRSRAALLAYADRMRRDYQSWREAGGVLPERLNTHYGNQPADVVLERYVWHMAQHVRQLDHLLAGEGGPPHVPAALYDGLPLPKALWT